MTGRRLHASMMRVPLAVRIALASALFGLLVAGGVTGLGYWALAQQLQSRVATELRGKRDLLEHLVSEMASPASIAQNSHRFGDLLIGHDDLHLAIVDPASGQVTSFSEIGRRSVEAMAAGPAQERDRLLEWAVPRNEQRLISLSGGAQTRNGQGLRYVLSIDRRHDMELLAGFAKATAVGLWGVLLLIGVGAWLIARTSLFPLRRFHQLASAIGTSSLGQRLSLAGLPVELEELAREFNAMLERIDEGYRRLQEFSADLAHEMRTPVATLLGRTQMTLSRPRGVAELKEALEGNIEEMERLSRLIADMLLLARTDARDASAQREAVDLVQEARNVADYLGVVAEEREVQLSVEGESAQVQADRLLVQRAITNLLSNAIRHAEPKSCVRVAARSTERRVVLAVANKGPVIAESQRSRLFDRFYRADAARARHDGGSGLGLAIVQSIMQSHGGEVAVESRDGTTVFSLGFPK